MPEPARTITVVAAVGAAAMGGVFFAFSAFVLPALERLPAAQGIAAMQSINVTAVRPAFMTALFGTAALCVYLGIRAVLDWGDRRATLLLAGSALYLIGTIALTAAHHVPLNDTLEAVDPHAAGAAAQWREFLDGWTVANHVRAAAALAAGAAFVAALLA
jgi:uncharacterized membrane protein